MLFISDLHQIRVTLYPSSRSSMCTIFTAAIKIVIIHNVIHFRSSSNMCYIISIFKIINVYNMFVIVKKKKKKKKKKKNREPCKIPVNYANYAQFAHKVCKLRKIHTLLLTYLMFQTPAPAENSQEFQRIMQIPCSSPT